MVTGWGEYEYIRYVENGRSRVMQRTAENCRDIRNADMNMSRCGPEIKYGDGGRG